MTGKIMSLTVIYHQPEIPIELVLNSFEVLVSKNRIHRDMQIYVKVYNVQTDTSYPNTYHSQVNKSCLIQTFIIAGTLTACKTIKDDAWRSCLTYQQYFQEPRLLVRRPSDESMREGLQRQEWHSGRRRPWSVFWFQRQRWSRPRQLQTGYQDWQKQKLQKLDIFITLITSPWGTKSIGFKRTKLGIQNTPLARLKHKP